MADEEQASGKPEAEGSAPEDAAAEQGDGAGEVTVEGTGDAPAAKGSDGPDIPKDMDDAAQAAVDSEPEWPPEEELTKDAKTMAMLAWLLGIFTCFFGPLLIYLLKKDESKFVAFHALQSLWFGVACCVILGIITVVTCGFGAVLFVAPWVVNILWCIRANKGEWAEVPVVADWARKCM